MKRSVISEEGPVCCGRKKDESERFWRRTVQALKGAGRPSRERLADLMVVGGHSQLFMLPHRELYLRLA
jgi:hypothetical protein